MSLTWALVQSLVHPITNSLTVNGRTYDLFAPKITVHSQLVASLSPAITGTVDDPTASIAVVVSGASYPATNLQNGTWVLGSGSVTLLSGANIITVKATDPAGNAVVATGTITVDVTAPTISLTTTIVPWNAPGLSGLIDDDDATVVVTFNSTQFNATVSNGMWAVPAAAIGSVVSGTVPVTVTATDQLGNVGTLNGFVTVTFDPSSLFSNGEQGWWYDANDLTEEKINWRRNLFTYSEDFAGNWIATGATVAYSDIQSPINSSFASKLIETTEETYHRVHKSASFEFNTNYVFSVYAKAGERKNIRLHWNASGESLIADVDLLTGTVIRGTDVTVSNIGNGWYRISKVMQRSSANALCIAVLNDAWLSTYIGDGVSGLYIWGAQFEKGDVATPYQKMTDFNSDFIKAFPNHTLYQDHTGTIPVYGYDQPVGLQLDKRLGLVRGPEIIADPDMTTISGKTNNGGLSTPFEIVPWQGVTSALHVKGGNFSGTRLPGTTVGNFYYVEARVWVVSGQMYIGDAAAKVGGGNVTTTGAWTSVAGIWRGTGSAGVACYSAVADSEWYLDWISVRELPGNHRFQTTAAARPMLRRSPILGAEIVTSDKWGSGSTGIVKDVQVNTITFSGTQSAYAAMSLDINYAPVIGDVFEVSFTVSGSTQGRVQVRLGGNSAYVTGNGSFRMFQTATNNGHPIVQDDGGVGSRFIGTLSNISIKKVNGYYSDRHFLEADGVDDGFETLPVNFNNSKQISLMSCMRKMSDLTTGVFVEMSSSYGNTAGSFGLFAPSSSGTPRIGFYSRGVSATIASALDANIPAPVSVVVTGTSDLLTNNTKLRINGVQKATSSQDQGGGSFANNSAYFFKRAGGSIPFRGNEYSNIMVNRLLTDLEMACLEQMLSTRINN